MFAKNGVLTQKKHLLTGKPNNTNVILNLFQDLFKKMLIHGALRWRETPISMTLLFALCCFLSASLYAQPGFNCPQAKTVRCKVFDQDPSSFVCTAESVKVMEGAKILGTLPFYGPPVDITPEFDFSKAEWELVLGEYSYGFPDCVYQDKLTKTKMNFIYRPEDLRPSTPLETCKFQEAGKVPHIICE